MKIIGWTFVIAAIIVFILGVVYAFFFRDGLAPGMIVSSGTTSLRRTIGDVLPSILFSTGLFIVGLILIVISKYKCEME